MKPTYFFMWIGRIFPIFLLTVLAVGCGVVQPFMAMNPPPDSDKDPNLACQANVGHPNMSCWMHTAANMLAGVGYGNGTTVQDRADDILADMAVIFNACDGPTGGWIETALQWWLASNNNVWNNNPYTVVIPFGGKDCDPWANANGARDIGNILRNHNMVGLSIRWTNCNGGHALTAWGDNNPFTTALDANPGGIRVTDSDTDSGGNVQAYTYDAYVNNNPDGDGWYFNWGYSNNKDAYIFNIVTLSPTSGLISPNSVVVLGSYQIQQKSDQEASDLHYQVGTDVDILTYKTWLNWPRETPSIAEAQPRTELTVDWNLSKPVPQGTWVTINTEFVEPSWNSIYYRNVYFTYPSGTGSTFSDLGWEIITPNIENAELIPNVTGGFVIGSFDVVDPKTPNEPVARYRLAHQYIYNQSPEFHTFTLNGTPGFLITNLSFGHSYGYPTEQELWEFKNWITNISETYILSEDPVEITIDWKGLLPYPEGVK